jgi:hypothetical protein
VTATVKYPASTSRRTAGTSSPKAKRRRCDCGPTTGRSTSTSWAGTRSPTGTPPRVRADQARRPLGADRAVEAHRPEGRHPRRRQQHRQPLRPDRGRAQGVVPRPRRPPRPQRRPRPHRVHRRQAAERAVVPRPGRRVLVGQRALVPRRTARTRSWAASTVIKTSRCDCAPTTGSGAPTTTPTSFRFAYESMVEEFDFTDADDLGVNWPLYYYEGAGAGHPTPPAPRRPGRNRAPAARGRHRVRTRTSTPTPTTRSSRWSSERARGVLRSGRLQRHLGPDEPQPRRHLEGRRHPRPHRRAGIPVRLRRVDPVQQLRAHQDVQPGT